jgi:hypothetical protein
MTSLDRSNAGGDDTTVSGDVHRRRAFSLLAVTHLMTAADIAVG